MDVGVITEWAPDEQTPEDFKGCNSSIKEISHINLSFDSKEWFYADEAEREIRRLGILHHGRRSRGLRCVMVSSASGFMLLAIFRVNDEQ